MGIDADAVGREVARRRLAGERVAGFVGTDRASATAMAEEMLGGQDELVVLPAGAPEGDDAAFVRSIRPDTGC